MFQESDLELLIQWILKLGLQFLNYVVPASIILSLLSVAISVVSVIQVRKRIKQRLADTTHLPGISKELILAVSGDAGTNWADSILVRQKISDEPKRHPEVLTPTEQKNVGLTPVGLGSCEQSSPGVANATLGGRAR